MATDSILRPGELKEVLLKEIEAADLAELDVREVGTVLEVKDGIATITLARPDAFNALDLTLARELHLGVLAADEDPAVRCVVLKGAGKAFCAGGDVKAFARAGAKAGLFIKEIPLRASNEAPIPTEAIGSANAQGQPSVSGTAASSARSGSSAASTTD